MTAAGSDRPAEGDPAGPVEAVAPAGGAARDAPVEVVAPAGGGVGAAPVEAVGALGAVGTAPVEAVIFDWGGTLSVFEAVDLFDMWRLAARRIAPDREDELCQVLFAVEEASFARTRTDQRSSALPDLLAQASRQLGLDVAEVVLEEAATHYLDTWTPHIAHDTDALPVLATLRAAGIRTGLLSNTHWPRAFHEHFLERDGLAEHLEVRLYTSEMSHMKPHPKAFREALHALGVSAPGRAVFVGDRLYDDVWGASMSGLRAVWKRNDLVEGYDGAQPDAVIDRLPELLALIEGWSGVAPGTAG